MHERKTSSYEAFLRLSMAVSLQDLEKMVLAKGQGKHASSSCRSKKILKVSWGSEAQGGRDLGVQVGKGNCS